MIQRRSVALLIETSNEYARGLLNGIAEYVHLHDNWSIYLPEQERGAAPPAWLRSWEGDGVIARIETDSIARQLKAKGLPIVDVSAARQIPNIPWVETDDEAIAEMAVDHFVERGFKSLAFCSDPGFNWSVWRGQYFAKACREAGCDFYLHESIPRTSPDYTLSEEKQLLAEWIDELPQPVGILACYDIKAQQLLDVCREMNVAVPEEVAVLGVDNDELLCRLASPPLSSITCDTHRTGYEAASLLDRMMNGERVSSEAILIKPLGIETRQSTDVLAIDDPDVALALNFIRTNAFDGINVNDVLKEVPLSRRVLETRFRSILGRTPHQEINRLRIERIKELLKETELPLSTIAERTGFQHDEYMSVAFKKSVGIPPSTYRNKTKRGVNQSQN